MDSDEGKRREGTAEYSLRFFISIKRRGGRIRLRYSEHFRESKHLWVLLLNDNIRLEEIKKRLPTEKEIQSCIKLAEEFNLSRKKQDR